MSLYWPLASVVAIRVFSINAGLEASTVTPGRTAPEESFTTPAIALCAEAGRCIAINAPSTSTVVSRIVRILPPRVKAPAGFGGWLYFGRDEASPVVPSRQGIE